MDLPNAGLVGAGLHDSAGDNLGAPDDRASLRRRLHDPHQGWRHQVMQAVHSPSHL